MTILKIIGDVWNGNRSLKETFWLWNSLVGGIGLGYFGDKILIATFIKSENLVKIYAIYLVACFVYNIWSTVGLWRSASKSESLWAGFVNLLILIAISIFLTKLVTFIVY